VVLLLLRSRKHHAPALLFRLISISILALETAAAFAVVPVSDPRQEPQDVIRVRTDLVAVSVVVTDARGRRLAGLKAEDFRITDDDRAARIDYFAAGTDRVALLFALDASGSAREIIAQQREAATSLFSKFGRGSRVAVLHFGDFVRLTVPFTSHSEAAEAAFNTAAQETKGTALFDGAAAAVRSFDSSGSFSSERRIVILISDGLDTLSSTRPRAVIERARERGVSFYVIHFQLFTPQDGRLAPRSPSKGFSELAEQTGGRYFKFGDVRLALNPNARYDLAPVFQAIEEDLRGQYVLGFYPGDAARDGRVHQMTVSLTNRAYRRFKLLQLKSTYSLKD
jgi:VWFA-related protein